MTCSICGMPSHIKQGNQLLCTMHYRFAQMKSNAKRHGKSVPSRIELAKMVENSKMVCRGCSRKMNWLSKEGQSTVASLQHNRDGSMELLCRGCNTRHATFDGDSFYTLNKCFHVCRDCNQTLELNQFFKDRSRPLGIKSYCKNCSNKRHYEWTTNNRESINQQQRQRRACS
jgi:hypothetical protein